MDTNLKPCPWCKQIPKAYTGEIFSIARVECVNPECLVNPRTPMMNSLEEAIELWNKQS